MKGFKISVGIFFCSSLIIIGTSSCSVSKRLHSGGYHIQFQNPGRIYKSENYSQKGKERDDSIDLSIIKEEYISSAQIYTTTDILLNRDFEPLTEKNIQNIQLTKISFQNKSSEKELRETSIHVAEWKGYEINETSQKVLKGSQFKKVKRSGGMITDGGMDWLVVVLGAIGFGIVFGLILGLLASSVQVFLVTAAGSALVFILIYLLLWGLFSLIGL